MTVNADITIFNKRYNADRRTELFYPTQIRGVSFYKRKNVAWKKKETSSDDEYTIRIPIDADMGGKEYMEAKAYEALSDEEFSGYWTLQPGAIIIKGLSDMETATETELDKTYADAIRIMNFTDNTDRCSDVMKHWRIGGE